MAGQTPRENTVVSCCLRLSSAFMILTREEIRWLKAVNKSHVNMIVDCEGNSTKRTEWRRGAETGRAVWRDWCVCQWEKCGKHAREHMERQKNKPGRAPECLSHRARRAYKYSKAQGPEKRGFAVGSHLYCLKDSLRITGKQRKKLSSKHA